MKNLILIFFLLWQTSKAQPIYFNLNGSFVYVNSGVQSITTSSGTTPLTKFSVYMTIFNGSQPHTIVLPDATTLVIGNRYKVENSSTGLITVQTNGGASLWIIAPGAEVDLTVSDISTAAGQWEKSYRVGNLVSGKFMQFNNSLVFSGTDASTVAFPGNAVLSGTNSGDNAVNTLYSGLVSNANHTGDATGATALTLATVNGNVGSFGSATQVPTYMVNAKGLITAAANVTIAIPQGAVTNLVSDLALKAPLASPTFTGTVTLPNNTVTNAMLAGSIDASTKLINVLPYASGGISASAATSATTGTMTVNMTSSTVTITPTGACTFNASGGVAGQILTFSITTSGTTSFTLTWGTNFRKTGTLATGTVSARFFTVTFICLNGTTWTEIARTAVQT